MISSALWEQAVTVLVQDYGPIGVFAFLLWRRQGKIVDAVTLLAEEHEDVDEGRVEDRLTIIGGDD